MHGDARTHTHVTSHCTAQLFAYHSHHIEVSDSSFQRELREPKYPPPDKPPKRSPVVQIPSVPNVPKVPNDNVSAQQKVEKSWDDPETPNAAKSEEKKKVEKPADLPEDNPEGPRAA